MCSCLDHLSCWQESPHDNKIDCSFPYMCSSDMDGSFYQQGPLELFVASKAESSLATNTSLVGLQPSQEPFVNLFQDEESVDISALVEACGKSSPKFTGSASGGSLSSAGFLEGSEAAFPFDTILNPLSMYGTENSIANNTPMDLSQSITFSMPQTAVVTIDTLVATSPAPGKTPKKSRGGSLRKKGMDKTSTEYREKRNRNNVAVRKSRSKSKVKSHETEQRVKELEDENSHLQNRITLLTKELNVLKSLFTSAGVPQPGPECVSKECTSE